MSVGIIRVGHRLSAVTITHIWAPRRHGGISQAARVALTTHATTTPPLAPTPSPRPTISSDIQRFRQLISRKGIAEGQLRKEFARILSQSQTDTGTDTSTVLSVLRVYLSYLVRTRNTKPTSSVLKATARAGVPLDGACYRLLVTLYGRTGQHQHCAMWLRRMEAAGHPPSHDDYNSLISSATSLTRARSMLAELPGHAFTPSPSTLRALLALLGQQGALASTEEVAEFTIFLKETAKTMDTDADEYLVQALSHLATHNRTEPIVALLPLISPSSYTSVIPEIVPQLSKAGHYEAVERIIAEAARLGVHWDRDLVISLIRHYASIPDAGKIRQVLERAKSLNIPLEPDMFNPLLHVYASEENVLQCQELLAEMETAHSQPPEHLDHIDVSHSHCTTSAVVCASPDALSYNTILRIFTRRHHVTNAEAIVKRMSAHGVAPNTETARLMFHMYCSIGDTKQALRQLEHLGTSSALGVQRGLLELSAAKGDVTGVFGRLREMRQSQPGILGPSLFMPLLKLAVEAQNEKWARQILKEMEYSDVEPDVPVFNLILQIPVLKNDAEGAMGLLREMKQRGLSPDFRTFLTLSPLEIAPAHPDILAVRRVGSGDAPLSLELLTSRMQRSVHEGDVAGACSVVEQMRREGIRPDVVVYNSLINLHRQRRDWAGAMQVLAQMDEDGVLADVVSFNSLLALLSALGREAEAEAQLVEMKSRGIRPNHVTLATLMRMCMGIEQQEALISRFEAEFAVEPTQSVYNTLLNAYVAAGDKDGAVGVVQRMLSHDTPPNLITFNTLAKMHAISGDIAAVQRILCDIEDSGRAPDNYSLNALLIACAKAGGGVATVQTARSAWRRMVASGVLEPAGVSVPLALKAAHGDLAFTEEVVREGLVRGVALDAVLDECVGPVAAREILRRCGANGEADKHASEAVSQ